MWDRMIQAEVDYRRERLTRGRPVKRRSAQRFRLPFSGAAEQVARRNR